MTDESVSAVDGGKNRECQVVGWWDRGSIPDMKYIGLYRACAIK